MDRWVIHSAVTIMEESGLVDQYGVKKETDKEICQFAAEFPKKRFGVQVPEKAFNQAFDEMKALCLQKAREAGLVRS